MKECTVFVINKKTGKLEIKIVKKMTNEPKPEKYNFSDEMVQGSKVLLNGIYGVPAPRIHSDIFKRVGNDFAFHNPLESLQYLTPEEIDEYFWYADTDSLYMDNRSLDKFPKSMFHSMNLGAWDIEHENNTNTTPSHYQGTIQPIDLINAQNLNFNLGNVVKYVCRAGKKQGENVLSDLEKAQNYINYEIERIKKNE